MFLNERIPRSLMIWLVVGVSLSSPGCSKSKGKSEGVYPVRGSVIVNGEPAQYANVLFIPSDPDAQRASAVVGEDGEFRLTTLREFDGAEPGSYVVTISWAKPKNPDVGEPDYGPELLPKNYQDPAKSGLKVEIEAKDNLLEPFDLKF